MYLYNFSYQDAVAGNSILILFNDESHSFDDVIEVLCGELGLSITDAEGYAHLIDSKVITHGMSFAKLYVIGICSNFRFINWNLSTTKP